MRENRTYGSEGGAALIGRSYPYLASVATRQKNNCQIKSGQRSKRPHINARHASLRRGLQPYPVAHPDRLAPSSTDRVP